MDIHELKRDYPREFQRQYERWTNTACYYDWWSGVYEGFVARMREEFQLNVDETRIYFMLHTQGAGATFRGYMMFARLMELTGHDETHLPLYLAVKEEGCLMHVSESSRYYNVRGTTDNPAGLSDPQGVFKDMTQDAWTDLVLDQWESEDWDAIATAWASDRAHELYKELDDEYDYMTSKESYIEYCLANDVVFHEEDIACDTV